MADVQTMYQLILRELRVDATTVPQKTQDDIMLSIAEALRYNRTQEVWFNKTVFWVSLSEGIFEYDLPEDFLGIVGSVFYRPSSTTDPSQTYQRVLRDGGIDMVEELRMYPSDFTGGYDYFAKGEAEKFAIDDASHKIVLAPIPSNSDGTVHFRYLADLGTITYKHSGSAWVFYEPFTQTAITTTSTYSNAWFTEGADALRERAMYYLWSRVYGGSEEGETKAQRSLLQWQDAMQKLIRETSKKQSIKTMRAHI